MCAKARFSTSLQLLGRQDRSQAIWSAWLAQYHCCPPLRCSSRLMVEGALPNCLATERIDWPVTTAREISSRSATVSATLERRREAGRIPPVLERIPCTVEWLRSKS